LFVAGATEEPLADTRPPPHKHHLDKRAPELRGALLGPDDQLYSTSDLAELLGVSTQFLEIARHRAFGPRYIKLSPRRIRYRKSDVAAWLEARMHASTREYHTGAGHNGGRRRKLIDAA
jgi:predicted DNA-binding transcriptional regulator AlpA